MNTNQNKLLIQENEYTIPYHWMRGRNLGKLSKLRTEIVLKLCGRLEGKTVLDYGCGDGKFTNTLVKANALKVFGIDISQNAIGFARKLVPMADFMVSNGGRLEYSDNYFDVIFSLDVIEHIPDNDRESVLVELKRALKPGGKLILTIPSKNKNLDPKHFRHFTPVEIEQSLKNDYSDLTFSGYFEKPALIPIAIFDSIYNRRFIWELFSGKIKSCATSNALYFAVSCIKK